MYKPKQENIKKLELYLAKSETKPKQEETTSKKTTKKSDTKGGMSCNALPVDKILEISKAEIATGKRINVNYGLMLQVGLFTGLRYIDLRKLRRFNLVDNGEDYLLEGIASKTGKAYLKPISRELGDMLLANAVNHEEGWIFHNNGAIWREGWLSRKIKKSFSTELEKAKLDGRRKKQRITIGAHSLRKTYGMHIYNTHGINAARIALQHSSLTTTSAYLGVDMSEQIELEQAAFKGLW